jgi:hypothetical protein
VSNPTLDGNDGSGTGCSTGTCDGAVLTVSSGVYLNIDGITVQNGNNGGDGNAIDNSDDRGSGTVWVAADIFADGCNQAGGTWNDEGYNVGAGTSCENGGTTTDSFSDNDLAS